TRGGIPYNRVRRQITLSWPRTSIRWSLELIAPLVPLDVFKLVLTVSECPLPPKCVAYMTLLKLSMPCSRRRLAGMAKTSFSPLKILATAVLSALALAGCSNSTGGGSDQESENPASPEPQTGGTLIYASGDAEPDCLDPHYGGNYPQGLISTQYLETLFTKDEDDEIIPWLAESSEVSDDGLTHTITLTDGITFHDGT